LGTGLSEKASTTRSSELTPPDFSCGGYWKEKNKGKEFGRIVEEMRQR
jgi:hypothetical protein